MERYDSYLDENETKDFSLQKKKIKWLKDRIRETISKLENKSVSEEEKRVYIQRLTDFEKRLNNLLNDREEYFGYNETEIDLMTMYTEEDEELVSSSGYTDNLISSSDDLIGYSDDLMGNRKPKK